MRHRGRVYCIPLMLWRRENVRLLAADDGVRRGRRRIARWLLCTVRWIQLGARHSGIWPVVIRPLALPFVPPATGGPRGLGRTDALTELVVQNESRRGRRRAWNHLCRGILPAAR